MPPEETAKAQYHAELERLRERRASAGGAQREAEVHVLSLVNRQHVIEDEIRAVHAQPDIDADSVNEMEAELDKIELRIRRGRLCEEGLAQRVAEADIARMRFVCQHMDLLQRELDPLEEAALDQREKAQQELAQADAALEDVQAARVALLRDDPDRLSLREPLPSMTTQR